MTRYTIPEYKISFYFGTNRDVSFSIKNNGENLIIPLEYQIILIMISVCKNVSKF